MHVRIRAILLRLAPFVFVAASSLVSAQIHGVPASVTSLGFGGSTSRTPGVAASVTSLGPNGFGGGHARFFENCCSNVYFQRGTQAPNDSRGRRSHRNFNHHNFFAGSVPVYAVPYTQMIVMEPDVSDDEENYEGGPTIFDRRGSSKRTRVVEVEREPAPAVTVAPQAPVVAQPSTVLIFRDGHQAELQNYAIVGDTIFDLADNRPHKILLADLDLTATRKANDERGMDFQLPGNPR